MFKKIGKYVLSAALVFTSVFAVAGCGKDDDSSTADPTAISSEDWKNGINYNLFSVETSVDVTPEDDLVGRYEINYDNGNYEINYDNIFYPDSEGGGSIPDVNYLNGGAWKETYKYNSNTMSWYWETVTDADDDSVSDEYKANITDAKEIIWKVKNNQSLFTKDKGTSTYRMNVKGSILENYVTGMKGVLGASSFDIETIVVFRNTNNEIIITFHSSTETIITMSFHDVSAIDSIVEHEIEGTMTRYKLENNSNDVNQITIEADYTGFHVVAQSGEEYLKDNGDGTYTAYVKNGDSFTSTIVNQTTYETEYKKYVTAHTFDWSRLSSGNFKIVDGKYVSRYNVDVTDTGTRYEYYFSNIVVDPKSRTITWDYKVHDKATNQDSPVYPIVISTVFTTITYPTVG